MTEAQKEEIVILMLNAINHARAERGLDPFIMTKNKFDQAQVRASQHSASILSHDQNDIKAAFGNDQFENSAYHDASGTDNMLSLYYNAIQSLSNMLNTDASSDWEHRHNFLEPGQGQNAAFGFHYMTDSNTHAPIYVLTFDHNGGRSDSDHSENMTDRISNYAAMGPTTPATTTVDHSKQIADLNNQINNLNNDIATQQKAATDLQKQLDNLKSQKDNYVFTPNNLSQEDQKALDAMKNTNPSGGDDHKDNSNPDDPNTGNDHKDDQPSTGHYQAAHRPGNDNQSSDHHNDTTPTNDDQMDMELPKGAHIVNNQVVDANGNVVAGWKVVNGHIVSNQPVTKNGTANNKLPQTGNNDSLAIAGLGMTAMASLLGLSVLDALNSSVYCYYLRIVRKAS